MKRHILILLIGVVMLGTSCQNMLSVDEVNPNSPSTVAPKLVLPAAINQTVMVMDNPEFFDFSYLWFGQWSVISGFTMPPALTQYNLINASYQAIWNYLYTNAVNLDAVEKTSTGAQDCYYAAIAKIMKAYTFSNLVDLYGDVPYSQAFQTPDIMQPHYDNQQVVYDNSVALLDQAMGLIANAPGNANQVLASTDIVYGGDMSKWLLLANTVKLRMLVHQAYMNTSRYDSYIKAEIAKTAQYGYIGAGQSALVNPGYLVATGKMNPMFEVFFNATLGNNSGSTYYMAGSDLVQFLQGNNDPRIGQYFRTFDGTNYAGNVFGATVLLASQKTSQIGYSATDPTCTLGSASKSAPLLTDFESLFIQSEAALLGWIPGDPETLYQSAVTQSFTYMGKTTIDAANYLGQSNPYTNWSFATSKLKLIITQKWVALTGVAPEEVYTDWRRTGFPVAASGASWGLHFSVTPGAQSATPPVRFLYPQTEVSYNNAAVVAEGSIDQHTSYIFWQPH